MDNFLKYKIDLVKYNLIDFILNNDINNYFLYSFYQFTKENIKNILVVNIPSVNNIFYINKLDQLSADLIYYDKLNTIDIYRYVICSAKSNKLYNFCKKELFINDILYINKLKFLQKFFLLQNIKKLLHLIRQDWFNELSRERSLISFLLYKKLNYIYKLLIKEKIDFDYEYFKYFLSINEKEILLRELYQFKEYTILQYNCNYCWDKECSEENNFLACIEFDICKSFNSNQFFKLFTQKLNQYFYSLPVYIGLYINLYKFILCNSYKYTLNDDIICYIELCIFREINNKPSLKQKIHYLTYLSDSDNQLPLLQHICIYKKYLQLLLESQFFLEEL